MEILDLADIDIKPIGNPKDTSIKVIVY